MKFLILLLIATALSGCSAVSSNNFSEALNSENIEGSTTQRPSTEEIILERNVIEEPPSRIMRPVLYSFNDWNNGIWIAGGNKNIAEVVWAYTNIEAEYSDNHVDDVLQDLQLLKEELDIIREKNLKNMKYEPVNNLVILADEVYVKAKKVVQSRSTEDLKEFNATWDQYIFYMRDLWQEYN